ncbi:MAG TPA: glycosyltransferase family 4 protein [Candidatus Polarisedimenticolaceae bacterium]|nr:glycosyltransferase family 4 protein [Candidatus Polarisedimenticolaceae bacterium]
MAADRPTIVHLVTRLELGGAQQNTVYCVRHHDRRRFRVALWAGEGGRLDDETRAIGDADVRFLPWLRHPIDPVHDAYAIARLAAMMADVDLVHTHSSKAGILGRLAARAAGVRAVVHTVHGWSFNDTQTPATRRGFVELERAAARMTGALVCVSASDRAKGLALGIGEPSQYHLIRSGIDPVAYEAGPGERERSRAALGFAADDVVVGSVGNLKPQKGPLDFVEAARLIHAAAPRARFFIAGDGELRSEVEAAIERGGLQGVIRLLGWRDDVRALLAAADIFLLTSLFEGLPRGVLQAMAAGLPVVATDTGGTAEVIREGETGHLVPAGRPKAASSAVVPLVLDRRLRERMGGAGRAALGEEFDIRRMLFEVEALYDDLLERRGATPASHLGLTGTRH